MTWPEAFAIATLNLATAYVLVAWLECNTRGR